VSTTELPPDAPAATVRSPIPCPRCGAGIAADQSWCTECGLAARTRVAPVPSWRTPLIAAGVLGAAAIIALIVAFVVITDNNAPVPTTAVTAPAPQAAAEGPVTTTTTVPAATTSPVTTAPAATPTVTVPAAAAPVTTATPPAIPSTATTPTTP